jgi:hypothetical protein
LTYVFPASGADGKYWLADSNTLAVDWTPSPYRVTNRVTPPAFEKYRGLACFGSACASGGVALEYGTTFDNSVFTYVADYTTTQAGTVCCRSYGKSTPRPACSSPTQYDQDFTAFQHGCAGSVAFDSASSLCAPGCRVCSALEWMERPGMAVPKEDYWTADALAFGGSQGACFVGSGATGTCDSKAMRVCSQTQAYGSPDHEGNNCNWIGCDWGQTGTTNQYFGGCAGNMTAGTLCCCY